METLRLIEHIKKEAALCKELIEVLHAETGHIVSRDYKALHDAVGRKEELLYRIESLKKPRAEAIRAFASGIGASIDAPLKKLVSDYNFEKKEELQSQLETLLSLSASIKEINDVNGLIVKAALENVGKALSLFGGFLPGAVYGQSGSFAAPGAASKGVRLSHGA